MSRETALASAGADGVTACTIVAKPLLATARVLARSFRDRHPGISFHVLLADEIDGRFEPADEPFDLVAFSGLEIPDATVLRFRYPCQLLSYAATPFLLRHLLARGFRRVIFLKQESLVVGNLSPCFEALGDAPILLTPHLTAPLEGPRAVERELSILLAGAHNAGFLGLSDHPEAIRFLDWWSDRVSTHGHQDVAAGFHYEQRWLDLVPSYFPGARLLRGPGDNVGHWNLPERRIAIDGDAILADGAPCALFRFSGFDPFRPERATIHSDRLDTSRLGDAGRVFERYRQLLIESGHRETSVWPYAWDRFDDGEAIPDLARELYRELGEEAARFGDPFVTSTAGSFRAWLRSPAATWARTAPALSRFWHAAWSRRADLRRAFPEPAAGDYEPFLAWVATSGFAELPGSRSFRPENAR